MITKEDRDSDEIPSTEKKSDTLVEERTDIPVKHKNKGMLMKKITVCVIILAVVLFLFSGLDISNRIISLINIPMRRPSKPAIMDLSEYNLEFHDEFDGDSIDETKWNTHPELSHRKGGYWTKDCLSVSDGCLHIQTKYVDGIGWCSECIDTAGKYEQTKGYFEIRCILPKGYGQWSAFWLLSPGMNNIDSSGKDGIEVDILEGAFYKLPFGWKNMVSHDIHYDGYDIKTERSAIARKYIVDGNPYEEFHTYGFEWTDKEYIFYIDGAETYRTDFGGICEVPEYLLASVEVYGSDAVPTASFWAGRAIDKQGTDFTSDFVIDYIRTYSKK